MNPKEITRQTADLAAVSPIGNAAMFELSPEMVEMVSGGKTVIKYYRNGNIRKIVIT